MNPSKAEIIREYGPFPSVDHVHGVTNDGSERLVRCREHGESLRSGNRRDPASIYCLSPVQREDVQP